MGHRSLKKKETHRLRALEMWKWRRIERIKWKDMKTNEWVQNAVGKRRKIVETIVNRKINWIGHILRSDGLFKDVLKGRMEGKRTRGRRRIGMIDELMEGTYRQMKKRAEDRVDWRSWIPWTCLTAEHSLWWWWWLHVKYNQSLLYKCTCQLQSFTTCQLQSFTTCQIQSFTTCQIQLFATCQIQSIATCQIKSFTTWHCTGRSDI